MTGLGKGAKFIPMGSLRSTNQFLVKKNDDQIRNQIKIRVYDSSVFEGLRLRKGHSLVALSKASRKKVAKKV